MKNTPIVIIVIVILAIGFFLWKGKNNSVEIQEENNESLSFIQDLIDQGEVDWIAKYSYKGETYYMATDVEGAAVDHPSAIYDHSGKLVAGCGGRGAEVLGNEVCPQKNKAQMEIVYEKEQFQLYKTGKNNPITFRMPASFSVQQFDGGERSVVEVKEGNGTFQFSILMTQDCDYDVEPGTSPAGCITNEEFIKNFGNRYTPEEQLSGQGTVYAPFPNLITEEKIQMTFSGEEKEVIKQTVSMNNSIEYYYYVTDRPFTMIRINSINNEETIALIDFSPSAEELSQATIVR